MFQSLLIWLRSLIYGKKEEPVVSLRLDEFHKTTFPELFNAAWSIVAGIPPRQPVGPDDYAAKVAFDELQRDYPTRGARIEFNKEGLGRVIPTDVLGQLDISMEYLPVKVRWNPTRMCLKPTEAQNRQFEVRILNVSGSVTEELPTDSES